MTDNDADFARVVPSAATTASSTMGPASAIGSAPSSTDLASSNTGLTSSTVGLTSSTVGVAPATGAAPSSPVIAVEHSPRACDGALVRAFGFLGKRWNGVILATLFDGTMGFAELRRSVGAISDSVLSDRLSELCTAGLVERRVFVGPPIAVEYTLTPAGEALWPAMRALSAWSRTNLPE